MWPYHHQIHMYETRNVIARPLFLLFRRSLEFGTLPTDWKLAEITAVHKKGSKSDSVNYRPITSQVLESLGSRSHYETPVGQQLTK